MTSATRRGRSPEGRAEVRRELVAAAVALFRDNGYDDTTVDDIAAAAGVGRRTFFRYFRGKEDAVSPDHERGLARVGEVLGSAGAGEPVDSLILRGGEAAFEIYTEDPQLSVDRFRVLHDVTALRDRESASVDHYRRLFTRFLRRRLSGEPDGELRAAVIGAAVVAAHNLSLRTWLDGGATEEGRTAMIESFRRVGTMLPVSAEADLQSVTRRLEAAADRLDRGA
jgi:AcrR family transcriptional regulator